MTEDDWRVGFARSIAVYLNGRAIPARGPRGEQVVDNSFFVVFNASDGDLQVRLPGPRFGQRWVKVLDTYPDDVEHGIPREERVTLQLLRHGAPVPVRERSVVLFRSVEELR